MTTRTSPFGAASSGWAAYEQQRETTLSNAPAVIPARKERTFSFGPFTLRYEVEESVDFSALAKAAAAQVDRIRRFNFADALHTETTRADLASASPPDSASLNGTGQTDVTSGRFSSSTLENLTAHAAEALQNLTYGADGQVREAQVYLPPSGRPDQAAAHYAAKTSAPSATTARTREALAAYLTAGQSAPQAGRLVSDIV